MIQLQENVRQLEHVSHRRLPGSRNSKRALSDAGTELSSKSRNTYCRTPFALHGSTADGRVYTNRLKDAVIEILRQGHNAAVNSLGTEKISSNMLLNSLRAVVNNVKQWEHMKVARHGGSDSRWPQAKGIDVYSFFTHEVDLAARVYERKLLFLSNPWLPGGSSLNAGGDTVTGASLLLMGPGYVSFEGQDWTGKLSSCDTRTHRGPVEV